MSVDLPIFPLNTVVFPGQQLPLHIFEPRYRKLVRDVLDADGEFGIALIRQGREVGGGAEPVEIGCCVRIADVQELPNGRFNLSCVGTRRFRLTESLGEDPYLRARVEFPSPPADAGDEEMATMFAAHLAKMERQLAARPNCEVLYVDYRATLATPRDAAAGGALEARPRNASPPVRCALRSRAASPSACLSAPKRAGARPAPPAVDTAPGSAKRVWT